MDALHFQDETIELIKQKNGHALVGLKSNNRTILKDVVANFAASTGHSPKLTISEKGHGRIETRSVDIIEYHSKAEKCSSICSAIRLQSHRVEIAKNKISDETRYLIATFPADKYPIEHILKMVRGHWGIENRLHYVKDRSMHEDRCTAQGNVAANMALMRSVIVLCKNSISKNRRFPSGALKGNADAAIKIIKQPLKHQDFKRIE